MSLTSRLDQLRAVRSRIDVEIDQELACLDRRLTYELERERRERAARQAHEDEVAARYAALAEDVEPHPYMGTETGYRYHRRAGQPSCAPCRRAKADAERERTRRRREREQAS